MHEVIFREYSYTQSTESISEYLAKLAESDGDGLYSPIRFYDSRHSSKSEALAEIERRDYEYSNTAVSYYTKKPTKSALENERKIIELAKEIESMSFFANHKSAFLSCKKCGSKLNLKYIKDLDGYCPLCGFDMRSDTFKKSLARKKEKLAELKKKPTVTRWLVKIEYHC